MWVLYDDEGLPVRYFNYAHQGAIEIREKTLSYCELLEQLGECLL